jgi:ribonuclease P protein component
MLPRNYRLRQSAFIKRVRQHGRSRKHPLAILLFLANGLNKSRFAVMASRRIGGAVERNRAKRVLREALRRHLDEIAAGWDFVVIARRQTPMVTSSEVEEAVLQLFIRAGALSATPVAQIKLKETES